MQNKYRYMLTIASVVAMTSLMFSSTLVNPAFAVKDSDAMNAMEMGLVLKLPSSFGQLSPEEVEELIGGDVQVSEDQRVSLPQDSYYHSDLIGCQVLEDAELLGGVTGILETGTAGCNLVVTRADGGEFMVPLVRKFVLKVDVGKKVIQVNLPSGLV